MTADHSWIGYWAQRKGGRAHLVRDEVTNYLIARCGRWLKLVTKSGGPLVFTAARQVDAAITCEDCDIYKP